MVIGVCATTVEKKTAAMSSQTHGCKCDSTDLAREWGDTFSVSLKLGIYTPPLNTNLFDPWRRNHHGLGLGNAPPSLRAVTPQRSIFPIPLSPLPGSWSGSSLVPEPVPEPFEVVLRQVEALLQLGALVTRPFVYNHLYWHALIFERPVQLILTGRRRHAVELFMLD